MTTYQSAPGPKSLNPFGLLPDLQQDQLGFLLQMHQQYGDVVEFRLAYKTAILLAHPKDIKYVLQENNKNYERETRGFQKMRLVLGNGLVTSSGEFWLKQRRIMQPLFLRKEIAKFAPTIVEMTKHMLQRWENHQQTELDISSEMMRLTLTIVAQSLFHTDVENQADEIEQAVNVLLEYMNESIYRPFNLPRWLPTPENRRVKKSLAFIDGVIYDLIARKKENPGARDLLTLLLQARDEETGQGMSEQQLRDEALTLFAAGHETVSNALTWTFYLLSLHPDCFRKLCQEVDKVLAGRLPTWDDLEQLSYTEMVIKEAMRLYPPAWIISRSPIEPDHFGPYSIVPGQFVFVAPYVTHRHPEFWENPEGFDPQRFAKDKKIPRFAYFPFGGGPHQCIGNFFAIMEAKIILAMVVQKYRLDLVSGHKIVPKPTITLRSKFGMRMKLQPRAEQNQK